MSVADEIETKFAIETFETIRAALVAVRGVRLSRRFEENIVLDTPDGTLKQRNVLLRLRRDAASRVTLKLPADAPSGSSLKVRREIETEVTDLAALEAVFLHLGYKPCLRYEKVRETWRVDATLVCLDTLPFGRFLEIEGTATAIPLLAERLGLSMHQALPQTYHELHQAFLKAQGLPPAGDFVFPPEARQELLAHLSTT